VTEASSAGRALLFPIQLAEARCVTCRAERRDKVEADNSDTANVQLAVTELDEGRRSFAARLEVRIVAPVLDGEVADFLVIVQGSFAADGPLDDDLYRRYVAFTPVVQLWPYARGYVSQLSGMLGVTVPPLPTLDALGPGQQQNTQVED
jgi:hypothetical protein